MQEWYAARNNKNNLMPGCVFISNETADSSSISIRQSACTVNGALSNSVCQFVAHLHVFLVHASIALQPFQQQLYFHNEKLDGEVFCLAQKRYNADSL